MRTTEARPEAITRWQTPDYGWSVRIPAGTDYEPITDEIGRLPGDACTRDGDLVLRGLTDTESAHIVSVLAPTGATAGIGPTGDIDEDYETGGPERYA